MYRFHPLYAILRTQAWVLALSLSCSLTSGAPVKRRRPSAPPGNVVVAGYSSRRSLDGTDLRGLHQRRYCHWRGPKHSAHRCTGAWAL